MNNNVHLRLVRTKRVEKGSLMEKQNNKPSRAHWHLTGFIADQSI